MKKALAMFLSVLMLMMAVPMGAVPVAAEEFYVDWIETNGFRFTIEDGEAILHGLCGEWYTDIPSEVAGCPVTTIAEGAFEWEWVGSCVVLPDTITTIGDRAFANSRNMVSIAFGSNVITIGAQAFSECNGLSIVMLPEGVATIGNGAFFGCDNLEMASLPTTLVSVGANAFGSCYWMTDIYYAGSVEQRWNIDVAEYNDRFYEATWHYNSALSFITDEQGLQYRVMDGEAELIGCTYWPDETLVIPDQVEGYPVTSIGTYALSNNDVVDAIIVPDTVTTIGAYAFAFNYELETIDLGEGVTYIGDDAFMSCAQLSFVSIPEGVVRMGNGIFAYCDSLEIVELPVSLNEVGSNVFASCYWLTDIYYGGGEEDRWNITVGAYNDRFYESTWHYYTSLAVDDNGIEYVIRNGEAEVVGYHGGEAFVEIPSSVKGAPVTSIGDNAFAYQNNLNTVIVPEGVTRIGENAFDYCEYLTRMVLPTSLVEVEHAFYDCYWLTDIYYYGGEEDRWNIDVAEYNDRFYEATWHYYTDIAFVTDENGLTYLINDGEASVIDCGLKAEGTLDMPSSVEGYPVTSIGFKAFSSNDILYHLTIPNSVTAISPYAFADSYLRTVILPNSITTIPCDAFVGSNLKEIVIPDGVTTIEEGAFERCYYLEKVEIPNSVRIIEGWVFSDCHSLTSVTLPNAIQRIEPYTFSGCSSLTSLEIPNSVTIIWDGAFALCSSLTSMTLPDQLMYIPWGLFRECYSLTDVTIPASVTYVDEDAFFGTNLVNVYYAGTESDREQMYISVGNDALLNAAWHAGSCTGQYDDACDPTCTCGAVRVAPHEYTVDCDDSCNLCGVTRAVHHVYESFRDNVCVQCGYVRIIPTMQEGVVISGEVKRDQELVYQFTPEKDGWYVFSSQSDADVFAHLYRDLYTDPIGYNDDDGPDGDFLLDRMLTAGTTYYLVVNCYDDYYLPADVVVEWMGLPGFYGTTGDCRWKLDEQGNLTIFGEGNMGHYGESIGAPWGNAIKTVTIKEGVYNVGYAAFYDCALLEWVKIPSSVEWISALVFNGCVSLKTIYLGVIDGIGEQVFNGCDNLSDVYYAGSIEDRESMEVYGSYPSFWNATWHYNYSSEPEVNYGDPNGDGRINNRDLGLIQQYLADWEPELDLVACDVNKDGRVNNRDLGLLQQYLADWDVTLG